MSDEVISSLEVPSACRFFRNVIADHGLTSHDIHLVSEHTKACKRCEETIGQMIHEMTKSIERTEAEGT